MTPLPRVMVALNGARRGKADHPALPVTVPEIVAAAAACQAAGADGVHLHVRDAAGAHVLDAGLYREALAGIAEAAPGMAAQVTTEAVGRYTSAEQRALVRALRPALTSVALREMIPEGADTGEAAAFYAWAAAEGIAVQHILYDVRCIARFHLFCDTGVIPGRAHQVQLVLGLYGVAEDSQPEELDPLLAALRAGGRNCDWMLCAFGPRETDCLVHAVAQGGKARIGFENNLFMSDGRRARDNAERVAELVGRLG